MRTRILLLFLYLCSGNAVFAQDGLPPNPVPGKCYIRCIKEDKWRDEEKRVITRPAYKQQEVVPAVYKDTVVQVLIKPASKRYEFVPAVYKTVTETIQVEDPYHKITLVPAKFTPATEDLVVQPAFGRFEQKSSIENCKSKDPRDCMVLCYVEYPEQISRIPVQRMETDATTTAEVVGGRTITITKEELVTPPQIKEIEIPAEYRAVKKRILVKDETVRETIGEALVRVEKTRVLEDKGGMDPVWVEIDCKLTDPNVLPIFYELGSARLTPESRGIIDEKLFALMTEKPLIRVEINSHTDSRGSTEYNMDLSQRRAQSVVDYLVSKGISPSRLIARGYGETQLKNNCYDGVDCTEEQHAQNRRTEFRVVPF